MSQCAKEVKLSLEKHLESATSLLVQCSKCVRINLGQLFNVSSKVCFFARWN